MKTNILYTILVVVLLLPACKEKTNECSHTKINQKENSKKVYEHLVMATLWFQQTAEMQACFIQTYNWAKIMLEKNLAEKAGNKPAAVVMDIDETILDNSPFEVKCIETGIGFSTETWLNWTSTGSAFALPGTLDFIIFAKEKGVDVIYISNRKTEELAVTMKNMEDLGFPFIDSLHFLFKEETSSKTLRREKVSEKYEIVMLIGDALTDFSEIYENRNEKLGIDLVEKDKELFGTKYIILPNPMYGEWEKAIYKNSFDFSESQKDSLRKSALISY